MALAEHYYVLLIAKLGRYLLVQHAHLVTMSFPYGPNVLALFNILSDRLRGTAPVQEVLRAGAAAAPGAIRPLHLALQDLQNSPGGLPQVNILSMLFYVCPRFST